MKKTFFLISGCLGLLAAWIFNGASAAQPTTQIQVGVFSHPPLQNIHLQGQPEGFTLELLEIMAGREDWDLNYTTCELPTCLDLLETGALDLVSGVPETELQHTNLTLNQEALIQNWGQVFVRPDSGIRQIGDLQAQTIALVRGDQHTKAFWEMLNAEGIQGNQILVDDYEQVLEAVVSGDASAGVVDHLYQLQFADQYPVEATEIIFNPVRIGFALPPGDPAGLGPILDHQLQILKFSPDSEYYQARGRWFHPDQTANRIPSWLLWTLIGTGGAAAGLLIITGILRLIIRRRTRSLRESEETYRRFFQTSKDAVFITTLDGQWVNVNQATLDLFGYQDREQFINTPVRQFYKHPGDRAKHIQNIEEQGFVKEYPVAMERKDGKTIQTLITTAAIRDHEGQITGFQGTIRDITERLRTQQELETSRERLDLAIKGTNVGLWDWNVESGEIIIDERWAEIIGYTPKELEPTTIETWEKLAHPEDLENSYHLISQHFAGDLEQYSCEVRMKHKDGHWVWILDRGRVVERASDGSPFRMSGTHLDITERIAAEQEIEEYIKKLETMQRITYALSTTLSLAEVLDLIMESITATIPYSSATIFLTEDQQLKIFTTRGLDKDLIGQSFPIDSRLFQEIKSTRRSIIIDDASRDPRFNGWGDTEKIRGWMGVPLLIKGELIGYITFDSYQPHAYGFAEAELAEPFAAQAAQAIENARLYEEVQRYAQELEQRVTERTAELQQMVNLMAGREVRMAELKEAVKILRAQLERESIEPAADDPLLTDYQPEQESSG
jgi:PAS domain S-box-containing protein